MRASQRRMSRRQDAFVRSVSAPVGGYNARDPISMMGPTDAVTLDNFFCTPFNVISRYGYSQHSTGYGAQINTLASYAPVNTPTSKLFAFAGTSTYDASSPGAVGAAVITGNSTSTFQCTNFGTSAGNFLVAVSGGDLPLVYNGSAWDNVFSAAFSTAVTSLTSVGTTATCTMTNPHNLKTGMSITMAGFTPAGYNGTYVITVTGASTFTYTLAAPLGVVTVIGTATPVINAAITGVDPTLFNQVAVWKTRLWFVEKNSSHAWYLPAASLGGAAAQIDLSPLFTLGGYLVAISNWSLDAGQGMDDYLVFMSSRGQVAVYKGTDPASASTFGSVGVYDLGAPIGNRCFHKFAGDVLAITQDGLIPLSKALMSTRVNTRVAVTDKVLDAMGTYVMNYASLAGWDCVLFPKLSMLLLNIPTSATTSIQFVMNTISGAWSTFSGWDAHCWELHNDEIYFGGSTFVAKAWDTNADAGTAINLNAQQSFNYFGNGAQLKQVTMARPIIAIEGSVSVLFGINVDFDKTSPTGVLSVSPTTSATWDSAVWDIGVWGGEPAIQKNWQAAYAIGYAISAHIVGQISNSRLEWSATDYVMKAGGIV